VNKNIKFALGCLASVILLVGAFSGGFIVGHLTPSGIQLPFVESTVEPAPAPTVAPEQQDATPADVQTLFAPFWETWNLIHSQYVVQPVDDVKLMEGAIKGMLDTLEVGRNYYENVEQLQEQNDQLNGKDYEGIGAYVDTSGEYLTIISPIKGSPAALAGLRPDDQVIAIDGEDMTGVAPEEARLKVIGPAGTDVVLTILREGETAPFDITITRATIITPLVEYEMRPDGIGYISLNTFGDTADQELRKALEDLLAQNPKGLILDLRFNGGGYLYQGIAVASEFLPADQIVVYERGADGQLEENLSTGNGLALDIPMVVLINKGSASASEIVAGALQDYERALLIGTTSFGKGSVQSVNILSNGGSAAITSAQWLTPNQRLIQDIGLSPDIYVEITQADFDAERDPQLDAAIQTISAIVLGVPVPTSQPTPVLTPTHAPFP
jgi:carboxyl-terminal processing protease